MIKQLFDSGWEFSKPANSAIPVTLPHDAQIFEPRSAEYETGSGGGYFKNGSYTYKKEFTVPEDWKGKNVSLEFEGIYQWSEVSINGNLAAVQPYGYSGFIVDITGYLRYSGYNLLVVNVNNSAVPNTRWYSGAGIYRHVWLRMGGSVYIKPWGIRINTPEVTPGHSSAEVKIELVNTSGSEQEMEVRLTACYAGNTAANTVQRIYIDEGYNIITQKIDINNAKLWSVEEPNLYTLKTEIILKGEILDNETIVFGFRHVAVDAENGFRLNGVPIKLKGGCVHHDNGLLGSASFDRAEERKVELMKASGFNAIRCAHNPPSPAMLDACDRLGMLVIDESFDCWRIGKNRNDYHLFFEDWWQRDLLAMIRRDFNHPSVVIWSIGNEIPERSGISDGYAWAGRLAGYVRREDGARPVTSALCGIWPEPGAPEIENPDLLLGSFSGGIDPWADQTAQFAAPLDIAGYNYLYERYAHDNIRFPKRVICGTETFPYNIFDSWNATMQNPHVIGDFVWTSIDYLGEAGIGRSEYGGPLTDFSAPYPWNQASCGDIDICGFKRPQSYYRDILWGVRDIPFIGVRHPADFGKPAAISRWGWPPVLDSWSYPGYEGKNVTVEVYSDKSEIELLINGKSQGKKPAGQDARNTAVFNVVYEPGTITAIARTDGMECGRCELRSAGTPAAIKLTADRTEIKPCNDLSYIKAEIIDEDGNPVKYADNGITFEVTGVGILQAVGSGNPKSDEYYSGNTRKVYEGRVMAVVRSTGGTGEIEIRAASEAVKADKLSITVTEV